MDAGIVDYKKIGNKPLPKRFKLLHGYLLTVAAHGVLFDDGLVVLRWLTAPLCPSLSVFASLSDFEAAHVNDDAEPVYVSWIDL